jgi:hypothetical protein
VTEACAVLVHNKLERVAIAVQVDPQQVLPEMEGGRHKAQTQ